MHEAMSKQVTSQTRHWHPWGQWNNLQFAYHLMGSGADSTMTAARICVYDSIDSSMPKKMTLAFDTAELRLYLSCLCDHPFIGLGKRQGA